MLVYLVTKILIRNGLQQHAAVLLDPVSRKELHAVVRWDEQMAVHAARSWALQHGYLTTEYKVR